MNVVVVDSVGYKKPRSKGNGGVQSDFRFSDLGG